jgi:rare lipoprotein A
MRGGRRVLLILTFALVGLSAAVAEVSMTQEGIASWYGPHFNGRRTSNGEIYDMDGFTAAHRTLPFGVRARVTNLTNGAQVVVRINDRGPFVPGRIIDLSRGAATLLGMLTAGTAKVRIEVLEEPEQKIYVVQLAAFAKLENAYRVQYVLRAAGIEAILEKATPRVTRVVVDHVPESELRRTLDKVSDLGFPNYLVREWNPG